MTMDPLRDLLGQSPAIVALRAQVDRLVAGRARGQRIPPVLLRGETGTGKGLVARLLHRRGPRADGPFVDVNCAAIPETLLEAEMFGWERGAFTDARQAKPGLFQTAHRGTIFLDEIGLLPEALQGKLLKVIEERSVRRLGGTRSEPVDVCIVAATSATADAARLREDLYHRLAVVSLWLPPLRDRGDDIVRLADAFLARACVDYDLPSKALEPGAHRALLAYPWPGNVRELMNVMERVALLASGRTVSADELGIPAAAPVERASASARNGADGEEPSLERLREALRETGWNVVRTAARLGSTRSAIRYRIRKFGLRPDTAVAVPAAPAAPEPLASAGLTWQRRPLAMLRVALGAADEPLSPALTAPIVRELIDKAQGFGGRVDEIGARGLVAVFGFDGAEDPASRAAHAALAMRNALERRAEAARGDVPARIALHAGIVQIARLRATSAIDLDDRRAAAAVLDTLVSGCEVGAIRVSGGVAPLLERRFHVAAASDANGAITWRLVGHEGSLFALGGRITPYIGRRGERDMLAGRLAQVRAGRGQVVAITGDAGLGKSRLAFEFREAVGPDAATCLEARCQSYGGGAYLLLGDLVRAACVIDERDGPAAAAEKVRARLAGLGLSRDGAPFLLHLLALPLDAAALAGVVPDVVKQRTFEVLRELLARLAAVRPLVLVLEDLHWIDATSEEFVGTLVDAVATTATLVVATYRSGYRPRWLDRSFVSQVALAPLTPDESRELLGAVPGGDAVDADVVLRRAEGNPFYIEELARALDDGRTPDVVPDTVQGVLRARVDALLAEDRGVLQAAAAVGRAFAAPLVARAAALPAPAVGAALDRLQAGEFVYAIGAASDGRYEFKHPLTHEVSYASLDPAERRAIHARIVTAIEGEDGGRHDERIEALAHHAVRAEDWERSARYLHRVGERALRRSANADAAAALEQAAAVCERVADRAAFAETAIDVRFLLQLALFALGEHARIGPLMREAETRAAALGDVAREARATGCLATHYYVVGDHAEGLRAGRRGLALAETVPERSWEIGLLIRVGHLHHARGELGEAIDALRRAVALLDAGSPYEQQVLNAIPSVQARTWLVWCLADRGDDRDAVACAAQARATADERAHPYSQVMAGWGLGYAHLVAGRVEDAVAVLDESLARCRAWANVHWMPRVSATLGYAHVQAGRVDTGVGLLEAGVAGAGRIGLRACAPLLGAWLAEAYTRAGRTREAIDTARQALELARTQRERGGEAAARLALADAQDDPAGADEAAARFAELGMAPAHARARRAASRSTRVAL